MFTNLFKSALFIHLIHLNNESGLLTTGRPNKKCYTSPYIGAYNMYTLSMGLK